MTKQKVSSQKRMILIDILCVVGYVAAFIGIFEAIVSTNVIPVLLYPVIFSGTLLLVPLFAFMQTRTKKGMFFMTLRLFQLLLFVPGITLFVIAFSNLGSLLALFSILFNGVLVFLYLSLAKYSQASKLSRGSFVVITLSSILVIFGVWFIYNVFVGFFGLTMTGATLPRLYN